VPDSPIAILTLGEFPLNDSPAVWANGKTVLDPSTRIDPLRSPPSDEDEPPQAATVNARDASAATEMPLLVN
jgi:hypothetical protein